MKKKTKDRLDKYKKIFLGDTKDGIDFSVSCISALFWLWLEVFFLKFFLTFAFGFVGYMIGDYPEAFTQLTQNRPIIDAFVLTFIFLQLIIRIRIPYFRKTKINGGVPVKGG